MRWLRQLGRLVAWGHVGDHDVFTPVANAFRFYEDGTESGSTPIDAQDTNISRNVTADSILHLRVRVDETGNGAGATTDDYILQFSKNAGAFTTITSVSANVQGAGTGAGLTDNAATTNRATNGISDPGTGSFVAGGQRESDGTVFDRQLTASNFTEHVWAIKLIAADLANNDTLDFRVSLNGGAPGMTNNVTPRITVTKSQSFTMIADPGSYAVTGQTAGLLAGYVTVASPGSYTITGQAANLVKSVILTADPGSYVLTGQTVNFLQDYVLPASPGAYNIAGQAAGLLASYLFAAEAGAYTLTGQATNLLKGFQLVADPGAFIITGQPIGFAGSAYKIVADPGTYALTGQAVGLLKSFILTADPGAYTLTGQDATLTFTPGGGGGGGNGNAYGKIRAARVAKVNRLNKL